jgi:hypothetical protein
MSTNQNKMETELKDVKTQCENLREENKDLMLKLERMGPMGNASTTTASPKLPPPLPAKTLLIGDSIIKDVDEARLDATDILLLENGDLTEASEKLQQWQSPCARIAICIGGDACADIDNSETRMRENYDALVRTAKEKAEEKSISLLSIPPQTRSVATQERIDGLNAHIAETSEHSDLDYVNNDVHFKLSNGLVNDGYLHVNGKQLSRCGMRRFLTNAGIKLKESAKGDPMRHRGRNQIQRTETRLQEGYHRRSAPNRESGLDHNQRRSNTQPFRRWGPQNRPYQSNDDPGHSAWLSRGSYWANGEERERSRPYRRC